MKVVYSCITQFVGAYCIRERYILCHTPPSCGRQPSSSSLTSRAQTSTYAHLPSISSRASTTAPHQPFSSASPPASAPPTNTPVSTSTAPASSQPGNAAPTMTTACWITASTPSAAPSARIADYLVRRRSISAKGPLYLLLLSPLQARLRGRQRCRPLCRPVLRRAAAREDARRRVCICVPAHSVEGAVPLIPRVSVEEVAR